MGAESRCTVRRGRRISDGKAWLETDELIFRGGDLRLTLPYKEIRSVRADAGKLYVDTDDGQVIFESGTEAETWAFKIKNPKSVIDKLGVKPGQIVAVINLPNGNFLAELEHASGSKPLSRARSGIDLAFLGVDAPEDLRRLGALRLAIKPNGAIWTIRPKGRKDVTEAGVRAAAIAEGLVDVKVVKFSETHTAEKFVIPVAKR